jgi:exopolysaccharide biosynthesis protein
MKNLLILLLISSSLFAQKTSDSLAIIQSKWEIKSLENGLIWKNIQFKNKELFEANESINIIETKLKNRRIKFALASADSLNKQDKTKGKLTKTSELALKNDALVAINGGFFDTKNGGSVDFIKINNQVVDTSRYKPNQTLPFHAVSAITIHKNKVKIIAGSNKNGWEKNLKEENVLLTGPILRLNNINQELPKNAFNDNRHPRSCLCITNDKNLLLITVDGRTNESYGMNLHELTYLTKTLNCKDAINLDGGGSTTLYIANQPENGVVNYPCDNRKFDHAGERAVSNIFYIKKR